MSILGISDPSPNPNRETILEATRRSANFHPSLWSDHFLTYASISKMERDKKMDKILELKEEVKRLVVDPVQNPSEKLDLIDIIQRLGVSYHFENEIKQVLQQIIDNQQEHGDDNDELYTVALRFRLLRQQGYNVSSDIFEKFKDHEGKFKESLVSDVRGMLSLYEASYLRTHGDDILEEALAFTTTQLESAVASKLMSSPLMDQVTHALKQPIRKGVTRLEARHFISAYPQCPSHNEVLLSFAKLDFNLLQHAHQRELSDLARWWKDLEFSKKLPFARDRVIECYFWAIGVYFEPQYSFARRFLTKIIAMISVIDDIYDVFGRLDELELFTEAVERWDISAIDQLPEEYMKFCYKALLDVYSEIEEELRNNGKLYRLDYAKEKMKIQIRAYLQEAKWFHQQYTPTMEEYMPVARVSSCHAMLATTSFVGMGNVVTRDSFEWLFSDPKMVKASEVVGRLMNDIVSHKFEQERGHVASAVECYMKQYGGTEEEAVNELGKQVSNAWKDMNEECLYPTSVPMPVLRPLLNVARGGDVIYKDKDGYTDAEIIKDYVATLFIDLVPVEA